MARFPRVKITGGPAGKDVDLSIDGQKPPGLYGFEMEIKGSVGDVVRLTTHQFVEVQIDMEAASADEGMIARVGVPEILGEEKDGTKIRTTVWIAEGKGKTIKAALLDAVENLPTEDPANVRTIGLKPS